MDGSYRGLPFKIFWTKIHAKFTCDRFYPIKTLEKALMSSFVEMDSCMQVKQLGQELIDEASQVRYSFHCYEKRHD